MGETLSNLAHQTAFFSIVITVTSDQRQDMVISVHRNTREIKKAEFCTFKERFKLRFRNKIRFGNIPFTFPDIENSKDFIPSGFVLGFQADLVMGCIVAFVFVVMQ